MYTCIMYTCIYDGAPAGEAGGFAPVAFGGVGRALDVVLDGHAKVVPTYRNCCQIS